MFEVQQKVGVDLRKRDKFVLWPLYFDSTKTRSVGRRVPESLAVPAPKLKELQKAVEQVGLQPEIVMDIGHPNSPWQKTGLIVVPKRGSKTQILRRVAEELFKARRQT
jgi:signal recognition particle subunit SRP19